MLCYRDMTFCGNSKECLTTDCPRYLSDDVIKEANVFGVPLSVGNFKSDCIRFRPIKKEEQ